MSTPSTLLFVAPIATRHAGGAVVKNRLLASEMMASGVTVKVLDTAGTSPRARLGQLADIARGVGHGQLLLSVSRKGAMSLVALLALTSLFRPGLRFALLVTGSGLPTTVAKLPAAARRFFVWCLSRCECLYVEAQWIKRQLLDLGAKRVELLPNPRPDASVRWSPTTLARGRLVFVSRVTPDKGVEAAMAAAEQVNAALPHVRLDVYGPIANGYESRFTELLQRHPATRYGGVLATDEVSAVLAESSVLLLPTTWATEGMPGVLVEAGMVGMPVIASDIEAIREVIDHGRSGLLVEPDDVGALAHAARQVITHPEMAESLARNLRAGVQGYESGAVVRRLLEDLYAKGWR